MLILSMLGIGIAWASILAIPYAILTGSLPANKMGTYMGIFNFFVVIPQILAASILGFFVRDVFGGESIYALVTGGISMFIAAVLILFVKDVDETKSKTIMMQTDALRIFDLDEVICRYCHVSLFWHGKRLADQLGIQFTKEG